LCNNQAWGLDFMPDGSMSMVTVAKNVKKEEKLLPVNNFSLDELILRKFMDMASLHKDLAWVFI